MNTNRKINQFIDTTFIFFKRDIKTRYADSLLGPLWIICYPLTLTLITTTIFSFVFRGNVGSMPYILYVLVGFAGWVYFNQSISFGTRSLINNRELITNNKFASEAIVISSLLGRLVDYGVNLSVILLFFVIFHQSIQLVNFGIFMIIISIQTIFQIGILLIASAANVYFRDVQNITDIFLQLLFYATPVIYPLTILPEWLRSMVMLNPLTVLLTVERALLTNQPVNLSDIVMLSLLSLLVLTAGLLIFKKLSYRFAENI